MNINKTLQKTGWGIVIVLSLVPVMLWLLELGLGVKFSTMGDTAQSFGDIFGLTGMAMFALVIIMSARLKFFEKFFKGLNEAYVAHHTFGAAAFCLLLAHPLLLAYNYMLLSFQSAAMFLLPGQDIAINLGILGLFVLILAMVATFYLQLKYPNWKLTHKFTGVAFMFGFFHVFMVGADVGVNLWLKGYLFILSMAAFGAYFYRALFSKFLVKTHDYTVKNIVRHEDNISEIELSPSGKKMDYKAGQFVFLKFFSKALSREAHPFTISSSPKGQNVKFAIKDSGDWSKKVVDLKPGDVAKIEGPFGVFNFRNYGNKKQLWIAGGVGITPFLGMARDMSENDSNCDIKLYYSVRDEKCFAFKNELEEIAERYNNLKIIFWNIKEKGFLTAQAMKEDLDGRDAFLCGPPIMMQSIKQQLYKLGVKKSRVHTEEFQLY